MKILLAVDGSGHSEAAVQATAGKCFPPASEVRVISVIESSYLAAGFPGEGFSMALVADIEVAARRRAHDAVDKAAVVLLAREENSHLMVSTDVLSGSPKRMILDDAKTFEADLIVVGSHGHGRFHRLLPGSVAQAVAFHATCSVEIARSRNVEGGDDAGHR